ncbi:putative late blight resistance protein homolog R1A-3 [Primulina tabacum]|uniref:putative late blight resistance protein homolog R1A-3 n=1 Tax=Primulina tabacum TaxID=48773 RepID=UPI003F596BD7
MVAAYAALMSLMHTSELILHPSQLWLPICRKQIESLLQKVCFLQEFLEDYSHRGHEEMAGLERQITDMAYAAEDAIEFHVFDRILERSTGSEAKSSTSFYEYIHELIEEMEDLIKTKVMRIKETIGDSKEGQAFIDFLPAVSPSLAPNEQTTLVGSDEKSVEIMERLTGQQSSLQIIAIAGMGGIGKTTLAKKVFEEPYIKHYFYIRGWVTISQNCSAQKIILELLSDINRGKKEATLSDDPLGGQLHKNLLGKRYLIVIDNLWTTEVWNEIRAFFPDNCNGCRILITTRQSNLARQLSSFEPFEMKFLDDERSWELLCDKVFGKKGCPYELNEIGKNIAVKCGGLPLAIVVIGRFLAKSNMTKELWEYVAENLPSIINSSDDENCINMLYWSYNNLPIHLKSCFLYMASVPHYVWHVNGLIRLWVADGFLKPVRDKSLEEAAYEYTTDLIDRNLIFVHERSAIGSLKTCGMHDLLRVLCLREAQREDFVFVIRDPKPDIPLEIKLKRRLCFQGAAKILDTQILHPASLTRSMIGEFGWTKALASSIRLLRVLHAEAEEISMKDEEIMQLVNLRYMFIFGKPELNSSWGITSSISLFWSLQTLGFSDGSSDTISLPSEIWNLPHLRHICVDKVVLPDPPCSDHDSHVLENLQTLIIVRNFRCTKEVLKRAPNLKELQVIYDPLFLEVQEPEPGSWPYFCLDNLVRLQKLESLKLTQYGRLLISLKYLSFPLSLKMLELRGCFLPWEDMKMVGSLPNLEALELWFCEFEGLEWCPVEEGFARLKLLDINTTDLLHWRADKRHFPILEHLSLYKLDLVDIPLDLGEIPTLRKIKLLCCTDSAITSAKQILEEQEITGNEDLQLIVEGKRE